jgi:uncharacterized membrane protein
MNIALWIASGILAAMYLMAFANKTFGDKTILATKLPWAEDFSAGTVKFIGIVEGLGALGLILPWLTGTLPILTPIAAAGLVVVQILAMVVHIRRGETKALPFNLILLLLALFVAVFRFAAL